MSERHELIVSKLKAFTVHLGASIAVITLYLLLVFMVWYPYPYFYIEKVWDVIRIVIGVDIFIGPLLTLVVYRAGKASLKFDMAAIIVFQVAALLWGVSVTYSQRPAYTALVNDNTVFSVVSASDVDLSAVKNPALRSTLLSGPQMVYVDLPYDREEYLRIGKENLKNGRGFAQYTQFYKPISDYKNEVLTIEIDIRNRMAMFPDLKTAVETSLTKHGGKLEDYVFVSVEGRVSIGFLMLRRDDLSVVDALLD